MLVPLPLLVVGHGLFSELRHSHNHEAFQYPDLITSQPFYLKPPPLPVAHWPLTMASFCVNRLNGEPLDSWQSIADLHGVAAGGVFKGAGARRLFNLHHFISMSRMQKDCIASSIGYN